MKKDELDLSVLENADSRTVGDLSENYKAIPDSDISRLYARSEELYKNRTAKNSGEYSTSVSGVEIYHRPVWKKVLTVAASLVLICSAITGAAIFYKNNFAYMRDGGGESSSGSIENYIGSTEEIPYETVLENGKFTMCYDNFTSDSNPLQISGAPYRDAVVAKPFKSVLVDKDSVVAPLNEWLFPVVSGKQYVGFVNCDMRLLGNNELSFWGGQMYAPKLNEALEKGSIALFTTVDGTYAISEDNTFIGLDTDITYSGSITFEQVNQGYNLVTADSSSDIVYGPMSKEWGITLKALDVTPTGLTIECTQSGGKKVHELSTGSYFVLQKLNGGEWVDVEYLPHEEELAWTSEAWIIQKEATTSWEVQWDMIYGDLPAGEYRIGKKIMNLRGTGAFIEGYAYAEFTIQEDDGSAAELCERDPSPEEVFENKLCTAEEALEWAYNNPVVVQDDTHITSGKDIWEQFFDSANAKKPASVMCVYNYVLHKESMAPELYEEEKDLYPQLFFCMLNYDGEEFHVKIRKSDETELDSDETYKYLLHLSAKNPDTALYRYTDEYVLVNDPSVTWEKLQRSMFSSQSGDWIKHSTVYTDMYN
ncbi:immunoglobulin-like domain-containing protein [Ruminococcus sp.]|uniref:immunoglobulin-like domain-containing protein n=1 Tax=Ruminococcus sp. TaxID=41978 RepID=UPI0025F20D49|nr:immunoglobulin-like domain-containing protein [Ruminococcus sp.]